MITGDNPYDSLPPLREILREYDFRADKSLGQNFILDANITDKIVRVAGNLAEHTIFEIGPGPGGLTRSLLLSNARKIFAIEVDERAIQALQGLKSCAGSRLELVQQNALSVELGQMASPPRTIIANLPYNIATPLLIQWLEQIALNRAYVSQMILMFQKEVADRIIARPGQKAYGRLSVITQWLCETSIVFDLPPSAFVPPPKVTSSVVQLIPKSGQAHEPKFANMEQVTAQAFQQRRKMIRTSLKDFLPALEKSGVNTTLRAENLTVEDFIMLARHGRLC